MAYRNLALDRVNLYLGEETKEKLRDLSKKRGMTMASLIRYLLNKELERDNRRK